MGKGFGRGAKSVAIVTHAQAKKGGKKTPRGLRGGRQKKKHRFANQHDEQAQLESSLGIQASRGGNKKGGTENELTGKSLAQQIAGIHFPHVVNKRQRGFKQLRKQIMTSVKEVRRRYVEKKRRQSERDQTALAARYRREQSRTRKGKYSDDKQ